TRDGGGGVGGDPAAGRGSGGGGGAEAGRWAVGAVRGGLVYYHCAVRRASAVSLAADVLLVLLCSLSILGLLFRHLQISVPVDPLEWQISQEMANSIVASLANTIGAAESVLRVAATGHDKKLFFKLWEEWCQELQLLMLQPSTMHLLPLYVCTKHRSV
ncbi:hypothetical protein PVAP13_6NG105700, partial [Panicum virgatum]